MEAGRLRINKTPQVNKTPRINKRPLPFVFLILLMHSVRRGPHTVGGVDQHVIDLEVRLWILLNRNPFLKGVFLIRMPYKFAQKRSCVRVPPQTEFLRINKPPRCPSQH